MCSYVEFMTAAVAKVLLQEQLRILQSLEEILQGHKSAAHHISADNDTLSKLKATGAYLTIANPLSLLHSKSLSYVTLSLKTSR